MWYIGYIIHSTIISEYLSKFISCLFNILLFWPDMRTWSYFQWFKMAHNNGNQINWDWYWLFKLVKLQSSRRESWYTYSPCAHQYCQFRWSCNLFKERVVTWKRSHTCQFKNSYKYTGYRLYRIISLELKCPILTKQTKLHTVLNKK